MPRKIETKEEIFDHMRSNYLPSNGENPWEFAWEFASKLKDNIKDEIMLENYNGKKGFKYEDYLILNLCYHLNKLKSISNLYYDPGMFNNFYHTRRLQDHQKNNLSLLELNFICIIFEYAKDVSGISLNDSCKLNNVFNASLLLLTFFKLQNQMHKNLYLYNTLSDLREKMDRLKLIEPVEEKNKNEHVEDFNETEYVEDFNETVEEINKIHVEDFNKTEYVEDFNKTELVEEKCSFALALKNILFHLNK